MIYTSASRDLEPAVRDSLREVSESYTGSHSVVAQFGQRGAAERLELHRGQAPVEVEKLAAADMTEPKRLEEFLRWGMERYPAQRYVVILGGHGAGFAGAVTDSERRKMMRLPELRAALEAAPQKPDLVVFNTCLMAQAEVAAELQPVTSALVGTQGKLYGLGLPLAGWLSNLSGQTAAEAAAQLSEAATACPERSPAVAALDLSAWGGVERSLDEWAATMLSDCGPHRDHLRKGLREQIPAWPISGDRPLSDLLDVPQLCRQWADDAQLPEPFRARCLALLRHLDELVVGRSEPERGGLSALLPAAPLGPVVDQLYAPLQLARNTRFDEAIKWLAG